MDRRTFLATGAAAGAAAALPSLATASPEMTERAKKFTAAHEAKFHKLDVAAGIAWWDANISGDDADFARKEATQNKIDEALADKAAFAEVKALKEAKDKGQIDDPTAARAVEVIYLMYLEKQVNPELLKKMVAKANAVEQGFNVYRANVDGEELADSKVREILKNSRDSEERRKVWEASKGVGVKVESDLRDLVGLRNEAAKELGFANYHAMQLFLNEQNGTDLIKLFDELDSLTREPFAKAKAEIDGKLASMCGVGVGDLMPWHYHDPFFQESPAVFDADLDAPYKKADLVKLCRDFYAGVGLPIDSVIPRSDLYYKKGKSPHAYCTDIDREGDVRVLANVVNNEFWMGTLLHEMGHSVYSSKNIPRSMPYVLRAEAHILTTEGVAMQFQKFSKSRAWLEEMGVSVENPKAFDEAAAKVLRNELLIFSRWCQVMLRFEKEMYEKPGQDLNALWWDLVEKYQMVKRPKGRNLPDYGAKIHIVSAPVYYHNYMMGQLFASQVHHALVKEVYGPAVKPASVTYIGKKEVGDFMKAKVFVPGKLYDWRGLTKFATGSDLSAQAFAEDFKG